MRGAWIEIGDVVGTNKFAQSLPMRGAWIEISIICCPVLSPTSLPMRGAWIEIRADNTWALRLFCRSPCGERGLKFRHNQHHANSSRVAPHAGSVD